MTEEELIAWAEYSAPYSEVSRAVIALFARLTEVQKERDMLRDEAANHCACEHDGRGVLTSECREHQDIREELDKYRL